MFGVPPWEYAQMRMDSRYDGSKKKFLEILPDGVVDNDWCRNFLTLGLIYFCWFNHRKNSFFLALGSFVS
jgi:hypothetical protein